MNVEKRKEGKLNSIYVYVIMALYPILGGYYLPFLPISLGDISLLCVAAYHAYTRKKLLVNKELLVVGAVLAVYNLLLVVRHGAFSSAVNNSLSMMLFFFVFAAVIPVVDFDLRRMYRVLKVVAVVSTLFLFVQSAVYHATGKLVYGGIPVLKTLFPPAEGAFWAIQIGRPTSFFYEPAHYGLFVGPILLLALYYKEYAIAAFFLLGGIVSTATTATAINGIIVVLYFFLKIKNKKKYLIIPAGILGFLILTVAGVDLGKLSWDALLSNIRILGTLEYFKYFNVPDFIFGLGMNRLAEWGSALPVDVYNYANSFFFIIMSLGLVGWGLIGWFLKKLFWKNSAWLPMALSCVILLFTDQMLFNRNLGYLIICLCFTQALQTSLVKGREMVSYQSVKERLGRKTAPLGVGTNINYGKVSVVVPVYNAQNYLRECIESILNQEYTNLELVLIDDGSTDDSGEIARGYAEKDSRVVYRRIDNSGVSTARNTGIEMATSEWIVFVDSDDVLERDYLRKLMQRSENTDFVLCGYTLWDQDKGILQERKCPRFQGDKAAYGKVFFQYIRTPFLLGPCFKLFRTNIIRQFDVKFPKDMSYGEDAAFVLEYLRHIERITCISGAVGYVYRHHGNESLSHKFRKDKVDIQHFLSEQMTEVVGLYGNPEGKADAQAWFVGSFISYIHELIAASIPYAQKKALFYEKTETYALKERMSQLPRLSVAERIVYFALKSKLFLPMYGIFYLRDWLYY